MENLSQYLVNNPKQIEINLKRMAAEKCLIAAGFGDNNSFLTAILDIDEKNQIVTIDCGPKEYLNKELLNVGLVDFKADFGGIKVLFQGRDIKRAGNSGQPTLSIKIPDKMYWVQRRIVYRMRSPLSKKSYCSVVLSNSEQQEERVNFKLYDLSIKGFSILSDTAELSNQLTPSTEFNGCTLVLEQEGIIESHTISFIVKSKYPLNRDKPQKNQRIGCEFLNISIQAESAFLRYMQKIEREIKRNQK